jgi:hypothetical protein
LSGALFGVAVCAQLVMVGATAAVQSTTADVASISRRCVIAISVASPRRKISAIGHPVRAGWRRRGVWPKIAANSVAPAIKGALP